MTHAGSTMSRHIEGLGTITVKDHSGPQPTVWLILEIALDESAHGTTYTLAKQIIGDAVSVSKRGHGCSDVLIQKSIRTGAGDDIEYISKPTVVENLVKIEFDILEPEKADLRTYADYCEWIERRVEAFSVLLAGSTAHYFASSDNGSVVTTAPQPR
jgi:hypothetical protein